MARKLGYCWCGCGRKTNIATRTSRAEKGQIKGQPYRYCCGHGHYHKRPLFEIEQRGYRSPCWIWQRAVVNGYARAHRSNGTRSGEQVMGHHLLYEREYGPIPAGRELHHKCGQRACVNPKHMQVVTVTEHRRMRAKLTLEKAREIRAAENCRSQRSLGIEYGVSPSTIKAIWEGRIWKEVMLG